MFLNPEKRIPGELARQLETSLQTNMSHWDSVAGHHEKTMVGIGVLFRLPWWRLGWGSF